MKTLEQARNEFSFLKEHIYLDSATTGLAWDGQEESMAGFFRKAKRKGYVGSPIWLEQEQRMKDRLAKLWNVKPSEIYFYSSTTEFVNLLAHSLKFTAGQTILMAKGEYPAIVRPWKFLAEQGVNMELMEVEDEHEREDLLIRQMDKSTKLTVASHVQYTTGTRADLSRLGRACHDKGSLFFVDGTQAFGAVPTDLREVDFYVASTFKWILGVFGLGVAMIKEDALKYLSPAFSGYSGSKMQYNTSNYPGLWTLEGSLDYFEEIGWEEIYERVEELTDYLMGGLENLKIRVLTPKNARAGIVSFSHENGAEIQRRMAEQKIFFAYRDGFVRIAPHFYNTEEDVDIMLRALKEIL